jgi:hypothetical protein
MSSRALPQERFSARSEEMVWPAVYSPPRLRSQGELWRVTRAVAGQGGDAFGNADFPSGT